MSNIRDGTSRAERGLRRQQRRITARVLQDHTGTSKRAGLGNPLVSKELVVRSIIRRVAKLEDRIAPREVPEEEKGIMQLAAEQRERGRRRQAAMGLPFEEPSLPPDCSGPPFDLAKVLRMRYTRPRRDRDSRKATVD